jgi:hypothetical protein
MNDGDPPRESPRDKRTRHNSPPGQSPSIPGSTVSEKAESTRVFNMLNSITHCSVENASHLLTSLEVLIFDGRHAFIETFMKLGTASSGDMGPSSTKSHPVVSVLGSHSVGRDSNIMDIIAVDEKMQGSNGMESIEKLIESNTVFRRSSRIAKTNALNQLKPSELRVAVHLSREEIEKHNAAQAQAAQAQAAQAQAGQAQAGQAQAGRAQAGRAQAQAQAQAQAVTSKKTPDMFDDMMSPGNELKLLEFATYIAAKSEPCQVHDRTEREYADKLREYSDIDADIVYDEMLKKKFINKEQIKSVKTLHMNLKTHFNSVKPATGPAKNVGQQKCRDCAAEMFETYKSHAKSHAKSSTHVPAAEVVLTMPYSVYREIKNDVTQQDDNDITTALQGNNGPRGFDATSSWGNNLVNWYWAMGSCDAAVQAFDKDHTMFAFQSTRCVFDDTQSPQTRQIPGIKSQFTVVDCRQGRKALLHPDIDCIPLQFGHKTVECVFNPNLGSKIESVMKTPIEPHTLANPPFICTYMPEVTLNHLSAKDVDKGIPDWKNLHESFINKCEGEFGNTFFRSGRDETRKIGDAIPDKITHMGITWVLTAVSQGPVSLDATLDKINLACPEVEPRNQGCTKQPKWVVLSDMFDEKIRKVSECAKYIGFTCGSSAKERGDAGKYWDMFWTQKCLNTPCSFWSGDYLAVAATTAPGLAWGIVVNSTVTVWGAEGQRPTINDYELGRIQDFVTGARSKIHESYNFFRTRIKTLLEYLAFIFIREIISLIRNPETSTVGAAVHSAPEEEHVALDTILILCAALSSITSSVELKTNGDDFMPEVMINDDCYSEITPDLFNKLVPASPDNITLEFCSENGIYDRESYFRKLIPLTGLDNALNKHSGLLWAYDYISSYNSNTRLQTTDLFDIYKLHLPRRGSSVTVNTDVALEKTFASVDVLCIAKMVRTTNQPPNTNEHYGQYNGWLQQLCHDKLNKFLELNRCRDVFCALVRFDMPRTLGGGLNRLRVYLDGQLFYAPRVCELVDVSVISDSFDPSVSPVRSARGIVLPSSVGKPGKHLGDEDSQDPNLFSLSQSHIPESVSQRCQPANDTNPEQFTADLENAYACSQDTEMDQGATSKNPNITTPRLLKPPPGIGKAPSTKDNSTSRSGAAAGSGAAAVRSRRNSAAVQRNFASGFGTAAVRTQRNPAATQGNFASGFGAAAVRAQRNPAATQGNSAPRSGRAAGTSALDNQPTMADKNKKKPWKGGNTQRTKRYKRNSNRRYKKNTTYSYHKHNRTIKHRNTRRRK